MQGQIYVFLKKAVKQQKLWAGNCSHFKHPVGVQWRAKIFWTAEKMPGNVRFSLKKAHGQNQRHR